MRNHRLHVRGLTATFGCTSRRRNLRCRTPDRRRDILGRSVHPLRLSPDEETLRGEVVKEESANGAGAAPETAAGARNSPGLPEAVDWAVFEAELDQLRVREKA